jgi:hypothetical protein
MLKVLECKRDEEMKPFDPDTAQQLATELYNAGGGRNLGVYVCTCCTVLCSKDLICVLMTYTL